MKKAIIAFTAGQVLQLLILFVGQEITYETNLWLFSAVLGVLATLMLIVGSAIASLEYTSRPDADMEEAAPIPKEINVTNTKVERVPTVEPKVEQLFGRKAAAK